MASKVTADLYAGARVGWVDAQVREAEWQQRAEHDAGHHDGEKRAANGDGGQWIMTGQQNAGRPCSCAMQTYFSASGVSLRLGHGIQQ